MRHAWWYISAPLVLGGLAWGVGLADDGAVADGPLVAQAGRQPRTGAQYFSRSGQSGEAAVPTAKAKPATVEKYTRGKGAVLSEEDTGVKNYYDELFAEEEAEPVADAPAPRTAARRTPATAGARRPAAPKPDDALLEDPEVDQVSHEEGSLGEVSGAGVINAEYQQKGMERGNVQHVQHTRPRTSVPAPPVTRTAKAPVRNIPADPFETEAPAPRAPAAKTPVAATPAPAAVKPVRTAAVPAAAPSRTSTARPAPPIVPAAPKASRTIELTSATEPSTSGVTTAIAEAEAAPGPQTPSMTIRWDAKGEVNVGQECKCTLHVKNSGKVAARDVVVEAFFPRSVRLVNAQPYPSETNENLVWNFESFTPGEEKSIDIVMVPSKRGELATSATVRFTGAVASVLRVEEPQLKIAVKGPAEITVGEAATQTITVANPGTGVARDVVVQALIPDGLEHSKGKKVQLSIGSLNPGESREVKLALTAIGGGNQHVVVEARAGGNLAHAAESYVKVTAPKLELAATGPSLRYINRRGQYTITATNKGAAANNNVRVTCAVAPGFEFVKADRGGSYSATTRTVSWFLGQVDAGQAVQLQLELEAKQIGDHEHRVQAAGENGSLAECLVETRVDGAAALVMTVTDTDDPIEIKTQTAYEIRVQNDGSKAAEVLGIACELPKGVELAGAEGPTAHGVDKGSVVFQPVASLEPGKSLVYRVKVIGKVTGNLRFRARLTSVSSPEPLIVEELTRFYGD